MIRVVLIILLSTSFSVKAQDDKYKVLVDTFTFDDLNSDGIEDTVIVHLPYLLDMWCKDTVCRTSIDFSFLDRPLEIEGILGFDFLWSPGDFDGDGIAELACIPGWFTSCWSSIRVLSFKDGHWIKIGSAPIYKCGDGIFERVQKIDANHFSIVGEIFDPEDWKKDSTYIFQF